MKKDDIAVPTESVFPFKPPVPSISFFKDGNEQALGELKFEGNVEGQLVFEGNADECAQIFFDNIIKLNSEELSRLTAENERLREALAAIEGEKE